MNGQLAVYREFGSLKAPVTQWLPEGLTLDELRGGMTCLPHDFDARGVICINGKPVHRHAWRSIRPKASHNGVPVEITFHAMPMGGGGKEGGGKNILAIVAGFALTAITGFVTGGGLTKLGFGSAFAKGTTGALLAGVGVSLGGSLLLQALVSPPSVPTGKSLQNPGAASAEGNVLEPNGAIPRVIGQRKVYPPLAAEPLTYFDGPDEVVEAVYVLAGPHQISDIRVGAATLEGLANVDFETREGWPGDAPITAIRRQGRTEALQTELRGPVVNADDGVTLETATGDLAGALPQPLVIATREDPDEVQLQLIWAGGLNRNASDTDRVRVPIRLRMRAVGAATWINLPELHFSAATQRQLRATIRLVWAADASTSPSAAQTEGWVEARISAPGQTQAPVTASWAADAYFNDGAGSVWMDAGNVGATAVDHVIMDRYTASIFLDTDVFPKDRYEIEVLRGQQVLNGNWSASAYAVSGTVWDLFGYAGTPGRVAQSRNGISDSVVVLRSVSLWNEHPLPQAGLATIAVRARNRALDRVSCLAGGWVRDWDGTDWRAWTVTSNPAPHLRDIYAGWLNLDPVPAQIVDTPGLVAWRTYCAARNLRCNALIEDKTVAEAAQIVAACGYAKPYMSEEWGVVRDYDRSAEAPVQMFTSRNMRDFQWTKAFTRLPDGFRVNFRDGSRDFDSHQISVFRTGISDDTGRMEQITLEGLTTEAEVIARARYDLAQLVDRSVFYSWTAPAEAIVCRRGSLIAVQHDSLVLESGSGRVIDIIYDAAGDVTALRLDSAVPVRVTTDMLAVADMLAVTDLIGVGSRTAARLRRDTGLTVHELSGASSDTDLLVFPAPIAPDGITLGMLVAVGPLGRDVRRLIVFEIRPEADLTASITAVDEGPADLVPNLSL